MRIALYHHLPPGGALRYMNEVVCRSAADHEYAMFTPDVNEWSWPLRPASTAFAVARAERRIAAQINGGGFDLAFVHGCRVMQAPGLLQHLAIPSVYMCQEPRRRTFERGYRPGASKRAGPAASVWRVGAALYDAALGRRDRRSVAAATALACNSAFSAEYIARAYERDAMVCYAGVDWDRFTPEPRTRSHYLSVGAVDATKGHDLAIDAIARLDDAHRLPLVVVGPRSSDEALHALEAQARRRGVMLDVRHLVGDDELVDLYRSAAATLCLSRLEPFGLTALESTSAGTPVVAVREGGFRETVSDDNGALVDRDPAAVAAAIVTVRRRGLTDSPDVLHEVARRWDWDATVKRLDELFQQTVDARS